MYKKIKNMQKLCEVLIAEERIFYLFKKKLKTKKNSLTVLTGKFTAKKQGFMGDEKLKNNLEFYKKIIVKNRKKNKVSKVIEG